MPYVSAAERAAQLLAQFGTADPAAIQAQHAEQARAMLAQLAAHPAPGPANRPGRVRTGEPARPADAPPEREAWVKFRRGPKYQGEYGFDWVEWQRDTGELTHVQSVPIADFTHCYDDQAHDYAAAPAGSPWLDVLEDQYSPFKVYGRRYYTPWLALRPPRDGRPGQAVTLELEVEKLNKEPLKKGQDVITFQVPANYRVTVEKHADPVTLDADNQTLALTIECTAPGPEAVLVVQDEHGTRVGQLKLVSNEENYRLPLRLVYVLLGHVNDKNAVPRTFHAKHKELEKLQQQIAAQNIAAYLNEHTLGQALITAEVEPVPPPLIPSLPAVPYQVLINPDEWAQDGMYNPKTGYLAEQSNAGVSLANYCAARAAEVYCDRPEFTAFRGITLYVHELNLPQTTSGPQQAKSQKRGIGAILPLDARGLVLMRAALGERKPLVLAHELGHVLGLTHSFKASSDRPKSVAQDLKGYEADQPKRAAELAALESERATLAAEWEATGRPETEAKLVKKLLEIRAAEEAVRINANLIKDARELLSVYENNKFKFTAKVSENIMDYTEGIIAEGTGAGTKAADRRVSYWHWQWVVMQQDVKSYHN